jgi:hypothetical protein
MSTQDPGGHKVLSQTHPRILFRQSKLIRAGILISFVGPLLGVLHFALTNENLVGMTFLGSTSLGLALVSGGCIKINFRARVHHKIYISPSRFGIDESKNYWNVMIWNLLLVSFAIAGLTFVLAAQ